MKVRCPKCGEKIVIKGIGRRPLAIGVKNVCDAIRAHNSVTAAARYLGCSRTYINKVLEPKGIKPRDLLNRLQK